MRGDDMTFAFGVDVISTMGTLLSSFYFFGKAIKYSAPLIQKALVVLWCMVWAVLYAIKPSWIPLLIFRSLICVTSIIFIFLLMKMKLDIVISGYLFSFGISYCLYYAATTVIGLLFMPFASNEYVSGSLIDYNQPGFLFSYTAIFALQLLATVLFFRIRRFRNGFLFLFRRGAIIVTLITTGALLVFATWVNSNAKSENVYIGYLFVASVLIIGVGLYIWGRRGIRAYQKQKMMQRSDEYYTQALLEKDKEIERSNEKIRELQSVIHKFTHRLEALERSFDLVGEKFGDDITVTIEDVKKLQNEFQNGLNKIKGKKSLPGTNISTIDNMFEYFAELFAVENIEFNIIVNGSILYLVEKIIELGKLETIIGDHLKDAMIAINASNNPYRSVMVALGLNGKYYEFAVFDSGIPFEVDTLTRLGTEHITTHADIGGSGIGFMTTFEIMHECDASLIIDERQPHVADYSKSVIIRFDGRKQYIIKTHRPRDFSRSARYTVIGHGEAQEIQVAP